MHQIYNKSGKTVVLITGATGFIGSLLVERLIEIYQKEHMDINLILPVRDIEKAREKYPMTEERYQCITFLETQLENLREEKIDVAIDYIFHCAAVTTSAIMISNPVEVADGIIIGTKNILELAREKKVKSMVYLSSMEVYGGMSDSAQLVTEDMLGAIDIYSARSCYPLAKRMAEHYCYSYYKEYDVPVKIARLAQVFGHGIDKEDNRIYAQFIKAICEKRDIVLHTEGKTIGNYCEAQDAVNGLFTILEKGKNGQAYNVVNEKNSMQIREMADMVADKIAGGMIKVVIDIPQNNSYGYAQETQLRLSSEKLRELGWRPMKGLEEMYRDIYEDFKISS